MSAASRGRGGDRPLGTLIRESRILNPSLKAQWLRLLPHLQPADRSRLETILRSESAFEGQPPEPGAKP